MEDTFSHSQNVMGIGHQNAKAPNVLVTFFKFQYNVH